MKRLATITLGLTFALALLCAFSPLAEAQRLQDMGKYQLVQGHDGEMFMLDTVTGDVYVRYPGGGWNLEANPPAEARRKAREQTDEDASKQQVANAAARRVRKLIALELEQEVMHMTVNQRSSKHLPGSAEKIFLHIGDVSRGQVVVSVFTTNGAMLLEYVTIRPGNIVEFRVAGESVYLKLLELKNAIIGQDFAEFEISKNRRALSEAAADKAPAGDSRR